MRTEAQKKARNKYRQKIKRYSLECYPPDERIIEKLEKERSAGGYNSYIKKLINADIERSV